VASQTLANIRAETPALNGLPGIRPLIGIDKQEIVTIAREIGTFDISTSSGLCCTIVPSKPSVAAKEAEVEEAESTLDMQELVDAAIGGMERW